MESDTDQEGIAVLVLSRVASGEWNIHSRRLPKLAPPREMFHTRVTQGTRLSLHFVSWAFDKPEINEQSSLEWRFG